MRPLGSIDFLNPRVSSIQKVYRPYYFMKAAQIIQLPDLNFIEEPFTRTIFKADALTA